MFISNVNLGLSFLAWGSGWASVDTSNANLEEYLRIDRITAK